MKRMMLPLKGEWNSEHGITSCGYARGTDSTVGPEWGRYRHMWEKIQKLVDRIESRVALWQLVRGTGVVTVGVFSGWFAAGVDWIASFGVYGWFTAALLGALLAAAIVALIGYARNKFAEARLLNKRSDDKALDAVNPLDGEFHRKRISLQSLVHPVSGKIANKQFTDCELIGPANIVMWSHCNFSGTGFINCDFILTKDDAEVRNVIPLENVTIRGGEIMKATIFVHPSTYPLLQNVSGITFVNHTPN